jgi:hypothetical protein
LYRDKGRMSALDPGERHREGSEEQLVSRGQARPLGEGRSRRRNPGAPRRGAPGFLQAEGYGAVTAHVPTLLVCPAPAAWMSTDEPYVSANPHA